MTEKPVLIVRPNWDPDEPRFIVEDCPMCGDDRQFKNGKCVFNQRLGFAYSVEEIVEVLNNEKELNQLKTENSQLLAYNAACEDTLMNVEVTLNQMIETAEEQVKNWNDHAQSVFFPSGSRQGKSITSGALIFWRGYLQAVRHLKSEIFPKEE